MTGNGTHVDDVAGVALDHVGENQAPRHIEQAFDVGVDHLIPIVGLPGPGSCRRLWPDRRC